MDHVEILFKEYDTLRAEIIARQSGGFQLVIIGGAVFTWFGQRATGQKFWIGMATLVIVSCFLVFRAVQDINLIAKRVGEIEQEINRLAGATLLKWESRLGSQRTGWIIRRKPKSD
jgi:hypothetical protein